MTNVHHTEIVQMGKHFLYLPIYYAKHNNFFGYIPPDYNIDIVPARPATDQAAYAMLMDNSFGEHLRIEFAICDPAMVLDDVPYATDPVILAGLITNAAFWAIDRRSRRLICRTRISVRVIGFGGPNCRATVI